MSTQRDQALREQRQRIINRASKMIWVTFQKEIF